MDSQTYPKYSLFRISLTAFINCSNWTYYTETPKIMAKKTSIKENIIHISGIKPTKMNTIGEDAMNGRTIPLPPNVESGKNNDKDEKK